MKFKNHIRKYRESLHLNQTQLGSIIGVTKNSISLYENKEMIPSAELAYKLCFLFNCEFTDLFYFIEE